MTDETRQTPAATVSHDHCINCVHSFGPLFLVCGARGGEFNGSPVHPQGWCDSYERAEQLTAYQRPEGQ